MKRGPHLGGTPKGLSYPNSGTPLSAKNWCRIAPHQFCSFLCFAVIVQPPSFAMAALAAICSAVPEKLRFSGFPYFSILRRAEPAFRQENFRLSAGNFAWTRHSARLASARKRGRTGRLSAAQLRDGGLGRRLLGRPRKAPLFRVPLFFNPQAGRARLPARKFPAFSRKFCLDAPFGAARFRSQEAELDGFQPPSFAMAALAAICSASFLLWPLPEPTGVPFRSTSTKKRLSWSGPSSPVRRYFSTWPLSRWTSS